MKCLRLNSACRRNRRFGITSIEVVLSLAVFFVGAFALYYLAVDSFAGLYQIISIHSGAPYI